MGCVDRALLGIFDGWESPKKILNDRLWRTVLRVARSSGLPPSVIEDTWAVDELLDLAELDELEGLGQSKRLVARVCATIHNEFTKLSWLRFGDKNQPPPTPAPESRWLPFDPSLSTQSSVNATKKDKPKSKATGRVMTRAQAASLSAKAAFADLV